MQICEVSPQKPRKYCHIDPSTWSPSLRSCEFFEGCPTRRSASLQRVMAGALYVGSVDGKSNSIMTPANVRCSPGSMIPARPDIAAGRPWLVPLDSAELLAYECASRNQLRKYSRAYGSNKDLFYCFRRFDNRLAGLSDT